MMRENFRSIFVAWLFLLAALACYVTLRVAGLMSAWSVPLVIFSGAIAGCVAALIYFAAEMRALQDHKPPELDRTNL
jgi:cyanate permease